MTFCNRMHSSWTQRSGNTNHKSAVRFACPEHKCANCPGTLEPNLGPGTTALECKLVRSAKNAAKQATALTDAPFVRALHVAVEVTNYKPAICVLNTYAPCVAAKKSQKVTRTLYAHVLRLSAEHASFSAT